MIINQISVFLENRAGRLAALTKLLADVGVDLRALNIAETEDYGVLRLIASEPERAAEALRAHRILVSLTPVVAVSVPDRPGGLSSLLQELSDRGVDISYMYSVFGHKDGMAHMILRVEDPERLEAVLQELGLRTGSMQELS